MKTNEDIFKLIVLCFIVAGISFAFGLTYLQTVCAGYKECSPAPTYVASPSATLVASPSATPELTAVLTPTTVETTPTNSPTIMTITTPTSEVTIMKEIYTQELPRVPETGRGGDK